MNPTIATSLLLALAEVVSQASADRVRAEQIAGA